MLKKRKQYKIILKQRLFRLSIFLPTWLLDNPLKFSVLINNKNDILDARFFFQDHMHIVAIAINNSIYNWIEINIE